MPLPSTGVEWAAAYGDSWNPLGIRKGLITNVLIRDYGGSTTNLKASAAGEHHEWESMYPGFAATARDEGFDTIASVFEAIAVAEKQHERRYLGLLANVEGGTVFKKGKEVGWRCRNCGYVHEDEEAPNVCPACAHPQAHFELLAENW